MSGTKERQFGPDVARCMAAVLVLCVHFFLNTGFSAAPLTGGWMTLSVMVRSACMPCVPLFLMLTGYLEGGKNWKRGHLRKLVPVLVTYLLCAVACLGFKVFCLHQSLTLKNCIGQILSFSAAPYGWYVGMYIGLFLLSPIFDLAWRAMEDWQKGWTVCALLFLTSLPALFNLKWTLLPDFWVKLYPVCFYFLGRWLRDHPVKVKGWLLLLGWGLIAVVGGLLHVWLAGGGVFSDSTVTYYNSPLTVLASVCVFSLLVRVGEEGCPRPLRWLIRRVARLSLPIYLISYVYDALFYPILNGLVPQTGRRLLFFPVMVLGSLLCSGLLAQIVDWTAGALMGKIPQRKFQS